jgi:hypothetical protein
MSPYINGECVVIDGGQWLRGAGEFNDLATLPDSAWEAMESARQKILSNSRERFTEVALSYVTPRAALHRQSRARPIRRAP